MKHKLAVFALTIMALLTSAVHAADPKPAAKVAPPKNAATINGEGITVDDLDRLYERLSPEMRANYDQAGGKMQFLENYIGKRLILQEASKSNFDRRPEVAESLQAARDAVLFDRYVRDIIAEPFVSEPKLREYYEAHKSEMTRDEMIKARHILATPDEGAINNMTGDNAKSDEEAKKKIESTIVSITRGANFADLATKYSEDSTARSGGDLGWFGRGKMVKEFEDAAFKLGKGQLSGVVKTDFGYHVIYVEDRKDGGVIPFDDVKADIRERLLNEHANDILAALSALTRDLRTQSSVSIYRENF